MQFKTLPHKLVARICAYCRENNLLPPGQVRTTKLIYLIEWDYYGWEQKRLTDLDWIFWHYGPWSKTLSQVLKDDFHQPVEKETEPGKFMPVYWKPPEFDTPKLKFDVTAEGVILRTLERFANMPYNKLLDYVYFETEPMVNLARGQELDFNTIPQTQLFVDPVSLLPPKLFYELKKRFEQLEISESDKASLNAYADPEFLALLADIDKEGSFVLPEGEVYIDDEVKADIQTFSED